MKAGSIRQLALRSPYMVRQKTAAVEWDKPFGEQVSFAFPGPFTSWRQEVWWR